MCRECVGMGVDDDMRGGEKGKEVMPVRFDSICLEEGGCVGTVRISDNSKLIVT